MTRISTLLMLNQLSEEGGFLLMISLAMLLHLSFVSKKFCKPPLSPHCCQGVHT